MKKFNSYSDFEKYRATDGWEYPDISFIDNPMTQSVEYTRELVMRWYDDDNAKVPHISGDISHDEFKEWVNNASIPCEIKKDGTNFNYLLLSDFNKTSTEPAGLTEKGLSHYNTPDKSDYLQMTEIKQVNVGLFQNTSERYKEVHFNFDPGCPKGFHKWFAHPYWNEKLGCYTKLWGRYDPTSVTSTSKASTEGMNCCFGDNQGTLDASKYLYSKGNLGADVLKSGIGSTLTGQATTNGMKLLEMTYWEHLVLSFIFSAYYKTFNHQSIFKGMQNDMANGNAGDWVNGQTDTLKTPHGKLTKPSDNEPYRFMYMENPLYGKQYIWGAGNFIDGTVHKYWMTFDDIIANEKSYLDKNKAEISGPYVNNDGTWKYITKIDLFGMPIESGGTSTTGFYDGVYTDQYSPRVAYLGGYSWAGARVGSFCRTLHNTSGTHWRVRGRLTMIR